MQTLRDKIILCLVLFLLSNSLNFAMLIVLESVNGALAQKRVNFNFKIFLFLN